MSYEKRLNDKREVYTVKYGRHPESAAVLEAWEKTIEKPTFVNYIKNKEQILFGEQNPMPDLGLHEALVRSAGHEMAAVDVLKSMSVMGRIFLGRTANLENYHAFHISIASLLWRGPGHVFAEPELKLLYSTMDRMLRGGKDWARITHVPAADRRYYQSLYYTRNSVLFLAAINGITEIVSGVRYGRKYAKAVGADLPAQEWLTVATAVKNGHRKVTLDDAIEASWAYLQLFDVDLYSLPLVTREGLSGYELVPADR